MLRDKKVPIKPKDKWYKTVIKPTITYGAECWAVRKQDENRFNVAEMTTLRWIRVIPEKTMSETKSNNKTLKYASVNIPETERVKLVRTQQEKRRPSLKKNDGHGCTGEEKKGAVWMEMD